MQRRYPLLALLSLLAVALAVWDGVRVMNPSGLPFAVEPVSARTVRIQPLHDIPLPAGVSPGEIIETQAQTFAVRSAMLAALSEGHVRAGVAMSLTVNRDGQPAAVPFTTRKLGQVPELRVASYLGVPWAALICLTVLIALWRGKDWAAWGISLWGIAFAAGIGLAIAPLAGAGLLIGAVVSAFLFMLARVGFYIMAESIAGPALTPATRKLLRGAFVVSLLAGLVYEVLSPLMFVFHGFLIPQVVATIWALPYLLAAAMLLLGYRQAEPQHRQRLRWIFWSSLVFVCGIQLSNVPLLGYPTSFVAKVAAYAVSMTGILYAVLRHSVVDIIFIVNRALVYSATLTVVVAIFILLESFIEKAALPQNANMIFELGVPLAVGFSLDAVRKWLEELSKRVFFRRKFMAEAALRDFARQCGYIEHPDRLIEQTLHELVTHGETPAAAFYWRDEGGYGRRREAGAARYAARADLDDRAIVALRAERSSVDLERLDSKVGTDGLLMPVILHGELLGAVALANRPGERYPTDERELLGHVVHEAGVALHNLHARDNARLIAELAAGEISPEAATKRAQALAQPA
jgi:hypothetical protein